MIHVLLFLASIIVLACGTFGCSRVTKPNPVSEESFATLDRATLPDRAGARGEFYSLQLGNRWRYAGISSRRENGVIVKEGRWTRETVLAAYRTISGKRYVRDEALNRQEGPQEFHAVRWLRQDRRGLYELGPPPIPRDSVRYPVPYERRLLAYPLHRAAKWVVDEARRVTAEVERMELLDTPAGRFRAWRIRVHNGDHVPGERAFVWYGREGYLGEEVVSRSTRRYPNGQTVTIEVRHAEWVQSIDLAPEEPGRTEVLGIATVASGGSLVGPDHRIRPTFGYDLGNAATEKLLFNDVWIDSTNVGSVLVATAASDPDFSAAVTRLTNGTADYVCLGACEQISCGATCTEEGRLFNLDTPDFGSATIEKISLRIDSLSFGRDDRGGQVVLYTFTIKVHGTSA